MAIEFHLTPFCKIRTGSHSDLENLNINSLICNLLYLLHKSAMHKLGGQHTIMTYL